MKSPSPCILTFNGGSSSIRFAVYEAGKSLVLRLGGKIDRIGLSGTNWIVNDPDGKCRAPRRFIADYRSAVVLLIDWLEALPLFSSIEAVGHRVVHGMKHSTPERVTTKLLQELRLITPYAPDHLPIEIHLIETVYRRHPKLPQIACFDTAFHRSMPRIARLLPIPRRYAAKGIERYGFHGLSYSFLMEELGRIDAAGSTGRVILAHLGNGASLAAVHDGKSMDTSMGLTPAAGLMMSTRTGDVDPGLAYFMSRTGQITAPQFHHMVNHESGLLGVSGTSSDMRDLIARESRDARAAEAIALFCYQAKKWLGSYAAALNGLDTLIFAGGIGENAPSIRERICSGLGFLGIELDRKHNARNAALISTNAGRVRVRVIPTNEETMIARSVTRALNLGSVRQE